MWRWAGLRGAGFSAAQVRALAAEPSARAADELIEAEGEVHSRREAALDAVRGALDALRRDGLWENEGERAILVKALRALAKGKTPAVAGLPVEVAAAVEALAESLSARDAARSAFLGRFAEDAIVVSRSLQEVARSPRFREAVVWQNRQAFHTALQPFLRQEPGAGGAGRKKHKELIASYVQRYCVKNDTIGFFGPVGWARFVDEGAALEARPGPELIAARRVYFESWCMDALAEKLSADRAMRPWLTPRRVPYLRLQGTTLTLPRSRPFTVPRPQAAAVQLCDGVKTARQIALILNRAFPSEVPDEQAGYELLEQLRARWLIQWNLDIVTCLHPERDLRQALARVEDEGLRSAALADLEELERGRVSVAEAAGDAERLDRAMAELDETFTRISGRTSTRAAGEMYAARTLVYEDCRRDAEVELGPEFLGRLGPPLSMLLDGARWYTYRTAQFYREAFTRVYHEMAQQSGSPELDCSAFWARVQPLVLHGHQNAAKTLLPEFQRHWAEILSLPAGERCVHYTVEQLRPLVRERFEVPGAGWSSACYHSPDVMIAAEDAGAVRRGDYQLILGEFHMGSNTLRGALFVAQHPREEELFSAIESDLPTDGLRIGTPKNWQGMTSRTSPYLTPRSHTCMLVTYDALNPPEMKKVVDISSFTVVEAGGGLRVRSRDGALDYDILEAFADAFHMQMINKFKLLGSAGHTPRITIGDLIVARESWLYAPEEFSFAYAKDDAERFTGARRWARERGIPRYVFAKSPVEIKPMYVDFDSPIYVDILAKVVRRTAEFDIDEKLIAVSEMLPAHGGLWLADAAGEQYTSEFRIVAVRR
ncbi:MAG: lantibiotic dehydratase family protein [Acidobacteria bacterium]|nr:lantibiotic dehydratase family protein [Acidobacteriota bacterium]